MEDNNSKHGYGQALGYSHAIAEVFYTVMRKKCPLDREIKNYFRKNKECGAKDRFVITESLFSLFRWYGWVKGKLPYEQPEEPLESKKFCAALSAALWLDNQTFIQFMEILYDAAQINVTGLTDSPEVIKNKVKGLSYFFKIGKGKALNLVPEWFKREFEGDDLAAIIEPFQKRPPVWIRVQKNAKEEVLKGLREFEVDLIEHKIVSNAFKLSTGKFNVKNVIAYQKGLFEIQDLASQCLGLVCEAHAGQVWWDVCAGAGGKSLLLMDQMKGKGNVIATDKRRDILKELERRAMRANFRNIQVADLDEVIEGEEYFDGVFVDAPCSCTGIWRRNPDLRWTADENICEQMTHVQKEILGFACKKVKAGGVLVYATCSLSAQENEDIVKYFLDTFPEFALEDFDHPITGESTGGMMHVNFNPDDCDATFAARFRKS